MTCKIFHRAITVRMYGTQRAEAWCETHQMRPDSSGMCPIGRIEEARDEALADIEFARQWFAEGRWAGPPPPRNLPAHAVLGKPDPTKGD